MSHLNHHGIDRFPGYERLGRRDIAKISSWTSLKILGLHNWRHWADLSPLRLLPLKELGCTDVCMLLDLLAPGCLQTLEVVTVDPGHTSASISMPWAWLFSRDVTEVAALTQASNALLEFPELATLGVGKCFMGSLKQFKGWGMAVVEMAELNASCWCLVERPPLCFHYKRVR